MLASSVVAERLVESCGLSSESRVLEIGTGHGMLTEKIATRSKFVESFEIDPELYKEIRSSLETFGNVKLICGDAFSYDFSGQKFDVCVTSLPYSQSLRFIRWLALRSDLFGKSVAIVQSEFADKLASPPGMRSFRAVSVIAQINFDIECLFDVGKEEFVPQPLVESRAIKLVPRNNDIQPFFNEKRLRILDFVFSFRGRKLSSAVKKLNPKGFEISIPNAILSTRIEGISPSEYKAIIPGLERQLK
jgi:16S rRNA (adenine1518-N6/adenine1519-N6)-dimethyltransferase